MTTDTSESQQELVEQVVGEVEELNDDVPLASLIAKLQQLLSVCPAEFRDSARLNIYAYDWEGAEVSFKRPMTDVEIEERLQKIDAQRKLADDRELDEWVRILRLRTAHTDRDSALHFIRTDERANRFHPSLHRKRRPA